MSTPNKPTPLDALRISAEDYDALLALIDQEPPPGHLLRRRRHQRIYFAAEAALFCQVLDERDSAPSFRVRSVDISRGGMGFLHGGYLHVGTACVLTLITRARHGYRMTGRVVRCEHVRGHVHHIGVAFDEMIDLEAMLRENGQALGVVEVDAPAGEGGSAGAGGDDAVASSHAA